MEENVIFKNPQEQKPGNLEPSGDKRSGGIVKKIIKLMLGILVVGIVGGIVAFLVIPKQEKQSGNKESKIVYWGLEKSEAMQPIISDFMEQNPNIKVTYVKQDIEQYRERILARIENDVGPDVFWFHNTWWPMLSSVLAPLPSDVITKSDSENLYYKTVQNDLIKNGAIYGIPLEIDTLSLYINRDLFDEAGVSPPASWIDFANVSKELTVKDENGDIKTAGAAVGTFDNIANAGDLISLFFVQNGSNLYDLSSTNRQATDALRFYTSFALGDKVWDDAFDEDVTAFANGSVAMYFGFLRDYFEIKAANPDLNFEVYPVPHLPDRDITIASYFANGVSVKSKYQKEALLFLKFLSQKETYQKLFAEQSKDRDFGSVFPRKDMASLLEDNEVLSTFGTQAENAVSSFFASNTLDNGINDKTNESLSNAVNAILSGTSPDAAVDTLSQGVSQILEQYSVKVTP